MSYNSKYKGYEIDEGIDLAYKALQEHLDISHLATKEEIPSKVSLLENDSLYITISDVPTVDLTGYAKIENVYDKTTVDNKIDDTVANINAGLSNYYTKDETYSSTEIDEKFENIDIPSVDLSNYYDKKTTDLMLADKANLTDIPTDYINDTELAEYTYDKTSIDQKIVIGLESKVDKVNGKQLSTEDFTTALKEKLDSLSNYDDSTIDQSIKTLRSDLDTLVSGDTKTAIESFNEIIAFLEGIEDSESLDNIIASIEQLIAAKYTKPGDGIPKTDLASDVQIPLEKANAITNTGDGKKYLSDDGTYKEVDALPEGGISGLVLTKTDDGASWNDIGDFATKAELQTKQDKGLKFENKTASVWVEDSTYDDFAYRCDISCEGVTEDTYARVVFALEQAMSSEYAPICLTGENIVSIWSNNNTSIIIPTILITI